MKNPKATEVIRIHKEYFDLPKIKKVEILELLQTWISSQVKELKLPQAVVIKSVYDCDYPMSESRVINCKF